MSLPRDRLPSFFLSSLSTVQRPVQPPIPPDQAASRAWTRLRPLESHALGSCVPVRGIATHGLFRIGFSPWRGQLSTACLPTVPAGSRQRQAWRLFSLRTPPLWRPQLVKVPRFATKKGAPRALLRDEEGPRAPGSRK